MLWSLKLFSLNAITNIHCMGAPLLFYGLIFLTFFLAVLTFHIRSDIKEHVSKDNPSVPMPHLLRFINLIILPCVLQATKPDALLRHLAILHSLFVFFSFSLFFPPIAAGWCDGRTLGIGASQSWTWILGSDVPVTLAIPGQYLPFCFRHFSSSVRGSRNIIWLSEPWEWRELLKNLTASGVH